jgi:hypothetical protein
MEKQKMIDELYFCAAQCSHCYDACQLEKTHNMDLCMMYDEDCAEICRLTGHLLDRDSKNAAIFIKLCVEMCKRCADECEKHPQEHCVKCAESCRKCIEMCDEYDYA